MIMLLLFILVEMNQHDNSLWSSHDNSNSNNESNNNLIEKIDSLYYSPQKIIQVLCLLGKLLLVQLLLLIGQQS